MTYTRPMFHPFIAVDPPVPIWALIVGAVGTFISGTGLWAYVTSRAARSDARADKTAEKAAEIAREAKAAVDRAVEESATVKQAKIAAEERLYESSRKEIHRILDDAQNRITKLEERAEDTEHKLERLRGSYVKVFMIAERQVFQIKSLIDFVRALIERIPGDKPRFDEAPFLASESELAKLSPDTLFAEASARSKTSEQKITGKVTLSPDTQ